MKKKLQVILSDESWAALETLTNEANEGFVNGSITYSDIVNEIVLTAKLDIRSLQAKHTNIRKSLRLMAAQKEIDIDSAIRALMDLKSKGAKKSSKGQIAMEVGE
jgi:hypothetical protein